MSELYYTIIDENVSDIHIHCRIVSMLISHHNSRNQTIDGGVDTVGKNHCY